MTTLGMVLSGLLIGAWVLYMLVYWGSVIIAGCISYLHDGEKSGWTLGEWMEDEGIAEDDMMFTGWLFPLLAGIIAWSVSLLILHTGDTIPVIAISITFIYILLRVARAVVRLKKKLDKHMDDRDAHKGERV